MSNSILILPSIADGEDKSSIIKNRIRKNYRHFRKWAKRTLTDCFRIYDRDIKEFPLSIDFYAGRFSVQFFSYDKEDDAPSFKLKNEVDSALCSIFGIDPDLIYWRTRIKRKKIEQYEKRDRQQLFFTVFEHGAKFQINLTDYLDTGLFLDHRETRQIIASHAPGRRLLNLFAYTCSFSVAAALAGAHFTKSVDLSNTYTDWGRENFRLNSIPMEQHEIVRGDCMKFLEKAVRSGERYDLIVVDPPTLSRSKKMAGMFDVQTDYPYLIEMALKLLASEGIIFFSTNSRKFKFDPSLFPACQIREISDKTLPLDFRNKKIHRCWRLEPVNKKSRRVSQEAD